MPVVAAVVMAAALAPIARAQLAITEAMSWASIECAGCETTGGVGCRPDFWELTNFGDRPMDITDYLFVDKESGFPGPSAPWKLPPIVIEPHESIVFVRSGWTDFVPDVAGFINWWGAENLPAGLRVFFYPRAPHGFDEMGDGVRLYDRAGNLLDRFYFDVATRGHTFTYDLDCGAAVPSEVGICGAFRAAACNDVGSPGSAVCGPVSLQITRQPVSRTIDAGADVTFTVEACGRPEPRGYQWYFNENPITNSAASLSPDLVHYAGCGIQWRPVSKPTDLQLRNVQPFQAGRYFVVLTNGLERLTSAVVTLTVNTTPTPPRFECPPLENCFSMIPGLWETNLTVAPGQDARFEVLPRGFPLPTIRWSRGPGTSGGAFVPIPGATNPVLILPEVGLGDSGVYRAELTNPLGTSVADAQLIVKPRPRLRITEAMSSESYLEANDWWELTNAGDETVNLCGYRWDNFPGNIQGGPMVTNALIVRPGESVVFLEGRTPEFFKSWWGSNALPHGLQFVTYTANGLDPRGDQLNLWNPPATNDYDWTDQVSFSTAVTGLSFWFDVDACPQSPIGSFTSSVGDCGAFKAAESDDVGSPGWTRLTPPQLTSIRRVGGQAILEWRAQPGSTTLVEFARELPAPAATSWTEVGRFRFAGAAGSATDATLGHDAQRFYRVRMIASAPCDCPDILP